MHAKVNRIAIPVHKGELDTEISPGPDRCEFASFWDEF